MVVGWVGRDDRAKMSIKNSYDDKGKDKTRLDWTRQKSKTETHTKNKTKAEDMAKTSSGN